MNEYPVMYGCWIKGIGWIRGENGQALMFTVRDIAVQTSKRIGNCEVYFIDQSLVDIEAQLLEAELIKDNLPFIKRIFRVLKA